MPLLNQKEWFPTSLKAPSGLRGGDKVFEVRQTREIFATYEEYLARVKLLQAKDWGALTGKTGLTYEEALAEDQSAEQLLQKFPKELEEPVLRTAHHSLLPLDELVEEIHSSHCSPSSSGNEDALGQSSEAQENSIPAVPLDSIRCWLMKAGNKENHGTKSLWVAKPEYQKQYSLAERVPEGVAKMLAEAEQAPDNGGAAQQEGEKRSLKKRRIEGSGAERGSEGLSPATSPNKKSKLAGSEADEDAWVPPPVQPIEVEEQTLKPGTNKHIIFTLLKGAGAEGMTVQQLVDAAKQQGLKEYNDSSKRAMSCTLTTDPAFVRVKKATYALRALMGDKPYEAIGKPPKKLARPSEKPADIAGQVASGSAAQQGSLDSPKARLHENAPNKSISKGEGAKEPYVDPPLLSLEEEERRLKVGSHKSVIFKVLKLAATEGMTMQQIMEISKKKGIREFADNQKGAISSILVTDPTFVRVRKGYYALRALMGNVPYEALGRPTKKVKAKPDVKGLWPPTKIACISENGHGNDMEVESMTEAERKEHEARKALQQQRQALEKAMVLQQKAHEKIDKVVQEPRTPSKRAHEDALGPMPNFELTDEQKTFQGDPDSKEDVIKNRQRVAALQARRAALEKEWRTKLAEAREMDAKASGNQEVSKAQRALKSAQKKISLATAGVTSAELALKEASKAVNKERAKVFAAEKRAEDKKVRDAAKAAERERKKAEALEAKRYPMEDLQLLQELKEKATLQPGEAAPVEDVPLPAEWLSKGDSAATAGLLYVADLVAQFAKVLKVKPPPYQDLVGLLEEGNSPSALETLWELYEGLLRLAYQEADAGSKERICMQVLKRGTVSEVLRRYLESRREVIPDLVSPAVNSIANLLTSTSLEHLSGQQHQQLLTFLCDDALDGESMREALQQRLDDSDDVKREMREAVAEKKGELKELIDADKEAKRQKRKEEKAKKEEKTKEEAARKQQGESKTADKEGSSNDVSPNDPVADLLPVEPTANPGAPPEADEEEEPSWELPEDLVEFQGDPTDRKGLLTFRQKQQAARKKLDKAREKWQAAARQREKEREAAQRAVFEAEKAKAKAKAAAEEEVIREQEAYEQELEKYHIRRGPLGLDRNYRQYWWGVGGQRAHIYVEDDNGRWAVWRTREELDALIASLDLRGVRELALHAALNKCYDSMVRHMKRAQAEGKSRPASAGEIGDRFPKRERVQAVFFSPSKGGDNRQGTKLDVQSAVGGLAGASLEAIAGSLGALQKQMISKGVTPPEQGWKAFGQSYRNAVKDAEAAFADEGSLSSVLAALKTCLVDLEEMLQGLSDTVSNPLSEDPKEENRATPEEGDEGRKKKRSPRLWQSTTARANWRVQLMEDKTLAALAFSAAELESQGTPVLASLDLPKPVSTKAAPRLSQKGGSKAQQGKGRQGDAAAAAAGALKRKRAGEDGNEGKVSKAKITRTAAAETSEEVQKKGNMERPKAKAASKSAKRAAHPAAPARVTRSKVK